MSFEYGNSLSHHGVKGMKWGKTRARAAMGSGSATRKLARADGKWEKEINSTKGFIKVNNGIADKMNGPNGHIAKFNNDPRWKNLDVTKSSKLQTTYHNEFEKLSRKTFESVAMDLYGESPSGKYTISFDWDKGAVNVVPKSEVQHSYSDGVLTFAFKIDANGMVSGFYTSELAHAGVQWGQPIF